MFDALSIGLLILTALMVGWIAFTFVHAWVTETGSYLAAHAEGRQATWRPSCGPRSFSSQAVWWRCLIRLQVSSAIPRSQRKSSNISRRRSSVTS